MPEPLIEAAETVEPLGAISATSEVLSVFGSIGSLNVRVRLKAGACSVVAPATTVGCCVSIVMVIPSWTGESEMGVKIAAIACWPSARAVDRVIGTVPAAETL